MSGRGLPRRPFNPTRKNTYLTLKQKKMHCGIFEEKSERELYASSESIFREIWPKIGRMTVSRLKEDMEKVEEVADVNNQAQRYISTAICKFLQTLNRKITLNCK